MHSQHDEERYILAAVEDIEEGTFLDIGAFDGKTFSNTVALAERGWSGVLVEAANEPFRALLKNAGGNSKLKLVNAAVAPEGTGMVRFWQTGDMVSTMNEAHHIKWKSTIEEGSPYRLTYVPTISYRQLITTQFLGITEFDVVNLDIEGGNWGVFVEMMQHLNTVKRVLCVEFDDKKDEITKLATSKGFTLKHSTAENMIFVRS